MHKITYIGGGNMGYALAMGLATATDEYAITVVEPDPEQRQRFAVSGIEIKECVDSDLAKADVVLFAVKPQIIAAVVAEASSFLDTSLVISIAAGTPLHSLVSWLPPKTPIVRCMPNTPALIGEGITGLFANEHVRDIHRDLAERILGAVGHTTWFSSDTELDVVTAVSGSGPAYFFYLIEALIEAGVANGLKREIATQLVLQTAVGSTKMCNASDQSPSQLRENVTSPGGTTERALQVLDENDVRPTLVLAVSEAFKRAQELAL